jgi:hypothetical protein
VKSLRQTFDVCAPGDLGRSAILAAVEQYEIRSAAGLQKACFDICGDDRAMLIGTHKSPFIPLCQRGTLLMQEPAAGVESSPLFEKL